MSNAYDVFISYSRGASAQLAVDIEQGLQRLNKPWHQLRAVRVFRDDSSMSANAGLWPTIRDGLEASQWLVLLATPEAAQSPYVNQELGEWLRVKGAADRILLVHAGGTIGWDASAPGRSGHGDFTAESTAIPAALHNAYEFEPRWVDFAWYAGAGSLGKADPRFVDRIADLAAPIRGIDKEQLISEDIAQHKRTRRLAQTGVAALSVMLVLSLIAGFVALVQRSAAVEQRNVASDQSLVARARQLASTATDRATIDQQSALLLATTAYRSHPDPLTASALHRVVNSSPQLQGFYDAGDDVTAVNGTADGQLLLAGTKTGKVLAFQRGSHKPRTLLTIGQPIEYLGVAQDGKTVVASGRSMNAEGWKVISSKSAMWRDGKVVDIPKRAVAMSPSGKTVAVRTDDEPMDKAVLIWRDGHLITQVTARTSWISMPDDNTVMGLDEYGEVMRSYVTASRIDSSRINMGTYMFGGTLSDDGNRFSFIRGRGDIEVWDFRDRMPANYGTTPLTARTPSPSADDVELSSDGALLATVSDGIIYVSTVVPRGQTPQVTELHGAGSASHNLRFTSNSQLLSANGTSIAVWQLDTEQTQTTSIPAELAGDCRACGSPPIAVSPNGTKVVVDPTVGFATVANLTTGYSKRWSILDESRLGQIYASTPAATWLDDNRLFLYSASKAKTWIIGGENMDIVEAEFDSPGADSSATKAFRRDDGKVMVLVDGKVMSIDPSNGHGEIVTRQANAVTSDGLYAAELDTGKKNSTVAILDTKTRKPIHNITFSGQPLPFLYHEGDSFYFLQYSTSNRGGANATEVLKLDASSSEAAPETIGNLGRLSMAAYATAADGYLFLEGAGEILQYSLTGSARMDLLPVESAPATANGVAVSDAGYLIVESETAQRLYKIPVRPDSWVKHACTVADRALRPADIDGVLDTTDRLTPGCGNALPSLTTK